MKPKSFKLQDETAQEFDNLFNELSERSEEKLTISAFIDELIENYRNPRRDNKVRDELEKLKGNFTVSQEIINKLAELYDTTPENVLKSATEYKENYLQAVLELGEARSEIATLNGEIGRMKQSNESSAEQLQQLATEAETLRGRLKPTDVVVQAGQAHALLIEILNRLSKKYGRETTGGEMLLKIFLCYFIENRSEWYYPTNIISNAEIEKLTGIAVKDWKKFLSNSNNNPK